MTSIRSKRLLLGFVTLIGSFLFGLGIVMACRYFVSDEPQLDVVEVVKNIDSSGFKEPFSFRMGPEERAEICRGVAGMSGSTARIKQSVVGGVLNHRSCIVDPIYPEAARDLLVYGEVNVEVTVDGRGKIRSAKALSGPELLRDAAVDAAYKTRVEPAWLGGEPINVKGILIYYFDPEPQ